MSIELYPVIAVLLLCTPVIAYCEIQHRRRRP
jgi:hypothetical protein